MLLEITNKIDSEPQEDQCLSKLELSLETLSVDDSKGEICDLESAISKISLKENYDDTSEHKVEAEISGDEHSSVLTYDTDKDEDNILYDHVKIRDEITLDSNLKSEDEAEEEKNDAQTEDENEEEEEDPKKDSFTKQEKEKTSFDEKQLRHSADEDGKASVEGDAEDEKESVQNLNDRKESKAEDSENARNAKKSCEEGSSEEATPSGKRLLPRGLGAGTIQQSDQQYPYPYHQGIESCADAPCVPSGAYSQIMSPQYAMSPTYNGMEVSPMSAYSEPTLLSPFNVTSNIDGISCLDFTSFITHDESPSPLQDESVGQPSPLMQDTEAYMPSRCLTVDDISGVTADDILEAIAKVENCPNTTAIPEEKVLPIKRSLVESLEGLLPLDVPVNQVYRSCDDCDDANITGYLEMEDFQNGNEIPNFQINTSVPDLSQQEAEREILKHLDHNIFNKVSKRMAKISNEELTKKDIEGDNPLMVVACQQEDSDRFRENFCAIMNRAKTIRMCCENPINNKAPIKMCVHCNNADEKTFYSPLAMVNNGGDTLLSSVLKLKHSPQVVNFICEIIFQNPSDSQRIFNEHSAEFYRYFKQFYPVLGVFVRDF